MKKKFVVLMMAVAAFLLPAAVMKAESEALPYLNKTAISVAVDAKQQLTLKWPENTRQSDFTTTWSVVPGYENYVSVDANGMVQGLAMTSSGGAEVKCTVKQNDGAREVDLVAVVHVTRPGFSSLAHIIVPNKVKTLDILGVNYDTTEVSYNVADSNIATIQYDNTKWGSNKLQIQAHNLGVTTASVTVDGQTFVMSIMVTDPTLNSIWITTTQGKTKQLKVSKTTGTTTPVWSSSNASIASVDQNGFVTVHKKGNVHISCYVDGVTKQCAFTVTYKKAISAINWGKKKQGTPYSQLRRMRKGYFDCSSFAWSVYRSQKVYLCSKRLAPVAAEEARFLKNKKRVVSYGYTPESNLLAGDLIFIKGPYNGRYRNICHVAMYIGNGKILHSTTPYVKISDYSYYMNRITLIGRPLK